MHTPDFRKQICAHPSQMPIPIRMYTRGQPVLIISAKERSEFLVSTERQMGRERWNAKSDVDGTNICIGVLVEN